MAKITVIVSQYNSGDWIQNRLDNLMEVTNISDLQIFCINANSPDSRDDHIPKRYPVEYIKLENRISVYAAWNKVIALSKSEYITNANTDDIISPNLYEKLLLKLETGFDIVYPNWYITATPNQNWANLTDIKRTYDPGEFHENGTAGHFPMWKRSLHDKIGLFNESLTALGDVEWWNRCIYIAKAKIGYVPTPLACYLDRNGQNLWQQAMLENPEQMKELRSIIKGYKANTYFI